MGKVTEDQIKKDLIIFIKEEILDDSIEMDEESTLSELGIDSFSVVELVLFLERKHGVSIPEKDMLPQNFRSIQSLAQCAIQNLN
jgi:acyl carrier protein